MEDRRFIYSTKNNALIYLIDDEIKLYIKCKVNDIDKIKRSIEEYSDNIKEYKDVYSDKNKKVFYYKNNIYQFDIECRSKKEASYKYYMVLDCSYWLSGKGCY